MRLRIYGLETKTQPGTARYYTGTVPGHHYRGGHDSTLAVNGTFRNVGLSDKPLPTMMAFDFMGGGYNIGVSHIGSRPEMLQMLELASKNNIKR